MRDRVRPVKSLGAGERARKFHDFCRPHKALPRCALLEKHPVRRVGGAEGAAEIVLRSYDMDLRHNEPMAL
jgi:hypothetical protein